MLKEYNYFEAMNKEEKIGLFWGIFETLHSFKKQWLIVSHKQECIRKAICEMFPFQDVLENRIVTEDNLHPKALIVVSNERSIDPNYEQLTIEQFIQKGHMFQCEKSKDEYFSMECLRSFLTLLTCEDISYRSEVFSKWNEQIFKAYMSAREDKADIPLALANLSFYSLLSVLEKVKSKPTKDQISQIEMCTNLVFYNDTDYLLRDTVSSVYPILKRELALSNVQNEFGLVRIEAERVLGRLIKVYKKDGFFNLPEIENGDVEKYLAKTDFSDLHKKMWSVHRLSDEIIHSLLNSAPHLLLFSNYIDNINLIFKNKKFKGYVLVGNNGECRTYKNNRRLFL